jgi:hypothetical protein
MYCFAATLCGVFREGKATAPTHKSVFGESEKNFLPSAQRGNRGGAMCI